MSRRWHPWRDLRGRPHITFTIDAIAADAGGGSFYGRIGDQAAIVVAPDLSPEDRKAALAHELVHDERRITYPSATAATMQREEAIVRRITAERLVPLDELEELVAARVEVEPVTVAMVAEEFAVGESVAAEAIRHLQARLLERELRRAID